MQLRIPIATAAVLLAGCATCRVAVLETTAPERPAWLDHSAVGQAEGAPTRRDAIEAARISAAMRLIEASFGVLMGSTYSETSRYSTAGGDSTEIEEKLRAEARGFVRWLPEGDYAERVRDECTARPSWRAWARVRVDPRELKAGLVGWLSTRSTARARVSVSGATVSISAPAPIFAYVVSEDDTGAERLEFGGRLGIGQVVERRIPTAAAVRVFVSHREIPDAGGRHVNRLYACLSDAPARRCGLIHRELSRK